MWNQAVVLCTRPWTISYQALDYIVLGHRPCGTWLCTMCYRGADTFYWVVAHELSCPWAYCTSMSTMWYGSFVPMSYRTMDHVLPNPSTYCTETLTMRYRAVKHMLQGSGHILPCQGSWFARSWMILYQAIDHVAQGYVPRVLGCGLRVTQP